jgi:hypothetical protein
MESNFLTNFQKAPFLFLNAHPRDYYQKVSTILDKVENLCHDEILTKTFFSPQNVKIINNLIKKTVYNNSCSHYIIRDQKTIHLMQIMKGIYNDYSQHFAFNQKEQIEILDKMVVDYCVDIIIKEIGFRINYLKDVFEPRKTIPSPINTSINGTKLQTPIITKNYQDIYSSIDKNKKNIYNNKIINYKNNIDINKINIL